MFVLVTFNVLVSPTFIFVVIGEIEMDTDVTGGFFSLSPQAVKNVIRNIAVAMNPTFVFIFVFLLFHFVFLSLFYAQNVTLSIKYCI